MRARYLSPWPRVKAELGRAAVLDTIRKAGITCIWRWQERYMQEGVDGLLRDKRRKFKKPPPSAE